MTQEYGRSRGETFAKLRRCVGERATVSEGGSFQVPQFLCRPDGASALIDAGCPYRFYAQILDQIADASPGPPGRGSEAGLASEDVVYLSFIRTYAALDGRPGTALSQIAFLPFLRSRLGVSVFLSLPTGLIGRTNRKGSRGSPFAVCDPFQTDPSLADPLLPELSADELYVALVESCRILGIRAGSILPMATLALDSNLFREQPALGFWWEAEPGEVLTAMPGDVTVRAKRAGWVASDAALMSSRFSAPPSPGTPRLVRVDDQAYLVAEVEGRTVTLANAFTDPPPGNACNAVWPDVAMLNYTSVRYPYFAGACPAELFDCAQPAFELSRRMLRWRTEVLGECVFLLDLCASVPEDAIAAARAAAAEAGCGVTLIGEELWEFDTESETLDAIVGPLVYCVSAHTYNPRVVLESLRYHLRLLELRSRGNSFLAGLANHDTMPPLPEYSPLLCVCYAFLPGAVTLIFSGSEWHAQLVTNPEFGLTTTAELRAVQRCYGDGVRTLFNDVPLAWEELPSADSQGRPVYDMIDLYGRLAELRARLAGSTLGYEFLDLGRDDCFGYARRAGDGRSGLWVILNWDPCECEVELPTPDAEVVLAVTRGEPVNCYPNRLTLPPGSAVVLGWGTLRPHPTQASGG